MQKQYTSGFSLIELMIVVTIMGILAAFAIPSYHDYVKRARFAEVVAATAPLKTAISLALQQGVASTELQSGKHGIPRPNATANLADISVNNGVIKATATKIAGGFTLILIPNKDGSQWDKKGTCVDAGFCNQ